jgi:hypothetical protein
MRGIARRCVLLAVFAAVPVPAQVVRGRVTEVNQPTPIPGALVSLLADTGETAIASVLTASSGDYAVRAPSAGRYRLSVKRIGVRRFVSAAFDLAASETRALDVQLDAIALTLPEVAVSGLCVTRSRDLPRVASLWDEARTALQATEISLRDSLVQTMISRHAGELEPSSLRVLFDWRSDARVLVEQPFISPSGDSLSAVGYWRQLPGDSVEFLAPDASALASNAFIRDHCFGLVGAPRGRPDLVGLSFVPSRERQLADISGTIWLDARRYELRSIEFRYTQLPASLPNANRVGGEVHYSRLTSGAWIVDRWFIRTPQEVVLPDRWPRRQLREEGGAVIADGLITPARPATVHGVLRDSAGRAIEGAVVRAIGTYRQALTAADGSFRFDSMPPGGVSIVAHTDGYDSFAVLAASRRVELQAGRVQRVDLRAPNASALRREMCPPAAMGFARPRLASGGVLRVLLVDSATTVPIPGVRFLATWMIPSMAGDSTQEINRQAVTDARGAATFCDLPIRQMELSVLGANGYRAHVMMVTDLTRDGVLGRVVYGRLTR